MPCPGLNHFLIEHSRNFQSFLIGALVARGIIGCGIELFCAVGSTHQVEYGIIASTEFRRVCSDSLCDVFPNLRFHIGRNVHRAAVADDDSRGLACLSHFQELILQGQLYFQRGLFTFVEKVAVVCQIVHARLRKHRRYFGNSEHLVAKPGKMLNHTYKCRGFTGTGTTRENDSFDILHILVLYILPDCVRKGMEFFVFFLHFHANFSVKTLISH